uniref:Uncharacterized protein n=2 Tax=Panagrolaimus sp. PS1159 TaxID=55785 RepID=A0AC35FWS4_9BILA
MLELDNLDKDFEFVTSEPSCIYDLSLLKNEFTQQIRNHIVNSYPNILHLDDLFDQKPVNDISYDNDNLNSGNVPLSQPLGIITDNIFNENETDENKIDKIMRKIEEYYLLPVESQYSNDPFLYDKNGEEILVTRNVDRLIIPDSLKVVDTFDWKRKEQVILNQFPVLHEFDPEQQINVIIKVIVQKIQEFKTKADAIVCEYGREIPTSYGKLLCYILGFFNYLPALPCFIQMASFTIFKDLPIYFERSLFPRRWLIIAPSNSRALKETVLEMEPRFYFPNGSNNLEGFKSGLVVYFYNQTFDLEELVKYKWDCTMIFAEAKENKPTDKAFDLLSKMDNYQKDRFGFMCILLETSENLWSNAISDGVSLIYRWLFPTLYEIASFKKLDCSKIMTMFFSSLIPFDEKLHTSEWLLKVINLLVYQANNDQIFPFMLLYNDSAINLSYEKISKLISQIRKQCNYTTLDNMNVIFMNESESTLASSMFTKNGIPFCIGEDIPGKLRLFLISEVYNIEAMNVFVFAHFSIEIAGKICAVMRKPSKYDKTIWFLQPKNQPIEMETFSTYFEVYREPFLDEEGRPTCMDEPTVLSKIKKEKVEDSSSSKKFCSLSTSFNLELKTEAGGTESYRNKFRKFLHIYQNARKQLEAEQRQQKENEAYQQDTEMEPSTPTSKQPRQSKKKPAPLKTQSSRQNIPKRQQLEQPRVTYQNVHEKIRSYLPPSVSAAQRLPFFPLRRSLIKKLNYEKQRVGHLDPLDEFNLSIFQIFGNYYRNIEKDLECYRAIAHMFNWDAVCIYFNYFLNFSGNYVNKLNINKKFFTRYFRKPLIDRTIRIDNELIVNRRKYEREFLDHLSQDDEKPTMSFNFRSLFERYRHHSQPVSTAGISASTFETLGKELSLEYESDYYYSDLIDVVQNSCNDLILPEDTFDDMMKADFDSILLDDVTKGSNFTLPSIEFDDENLDQRFSSSNYEIFVSDYLSGIENLHRCINDICNSSFNNLSKIPDSCQIILDFFDFIVDEPISPTEPSECDNIKEEISYSKSLDAMDISADAMDTFISIGPTRRKIKNLENVQNYNLSSEIMPIRVSPFRGFDKNPLSMLFGSICDEDSNDDGDNSSEYGSTISSDEENIDSNERKRKAENDDENDFLGDVKRRKVLNESGSITYDSSGNDNSETRPPPPKFHLSPSEDSNSQNSSILQIMPIEEEISFAIFYLLKEKSNNYMRTCLPYLNSLDKNSKLTILQRLSTENSIKLGEFERSFYEQPLVRKALADISDKKDITNDRDVFEDIINLNSVFSREFFDEKEIAQQTSKKFSISFNDLMLRQYYERAIPITLSSQRYSYGDTSVMPSKIQIMRRPIASQQTPPTIQNQPKIISPMTPAGSRPITPNIYRSPQATVNPEQQPQWQQTQAQQQYQRVVPANFNQPRPMYPQQNSINGMLTPPNNHSVDTVILRPSTPQHQTILRQPMQQSGTSGTVMVPNQITSVGRPLTFPYEYHATCQDKCECTNKDLGQPLYYNEDIPNYDDENIDPLMHLQKLSESSSSNSSLTLLYLLCQSIPFVDSKLKDDNETYNFLADNITTEYTPPIIPPLSYARSNCLKKSRERFKSRQQIYVTLRGLGKSDIMNLLKQYEMKFNFPFNDIFHLKYRRSPAYDIRYLLNLWRTMSLSNKLRRILNTQTTDPKMKFLQSMAPRAPLERSAEMENIDNGIKKIVLERCSSLPELNENKELPPSQIIYFRNGFKEAMSYSNKKFSTFKFNKKRKIHQDEEPVPEMPKIIKERYSRTYHLGISKMSLTINKRKVSTISRFYRTRRHPNPRKILPLYRRWRKSFHVEEYWKYTKDKREPSQAMFDMNLDQFF